MLNSSGRLICRFWKAVLSQTPSVIFFSFLFFLFFVSSMVSVHLCSKLQWWLVKQSPNVSTLCSLSGHGFAFPWINFQHQMTRMNSRQMPLVSGIKTNYISRLSPRVPLLALRSNLFNDTIAGPWNGRPSSLLLRIPGDCREPSLAAWLLCLGNCCHSLGVLEQGLALFCFSSGLSRSSFFSGFPTRADFYKAHQF